MVVKMYVRALSWRDDVRECSITFLYHIYYVNLDAHCHFFIDGFEIFLSLHHTISYLSNIFAY